MKRVIVLFFLLSGSAFATDVGTSGLTKSLDGKTVTCASPADNNTAGYRPLLYTLQIVNGALDFEVGVSSLVCSYANSQGQWISRLFGDPIPTSYNADIPGTIYLDHQEFMVVSENYDTLGTVATENVSLQQLQYTISLQNFLTATEQLRLAAGQTVNRQFEFFIHGTSVVKSGADSISLGMWTGGSYFLDFALVQSHGAVRVKTSQLR